MAEDARGIQLTSSLEHRQEVEGGATNEASHGCSRAAKS